MSETVAVVGAGPVGLSFALATAKTSSLNVHLIEAGSPAAQPESADFDHRVYALSPGSKTFLESLDVWQALPRERIAPVTAMQVRGDDGASEIDFEWRSPLAFIVEHNTLMRVLWSKLHEQARVRIHAPAQPCDLSLSERAASLSLQDGDTIEAALVVGADGANSWVRSRAGLQVEEKSYQSFGVVANFSAQRPHQGIARQWFTQDSVLAWLPLPKQCISIVWSVNDARVDELLALAPQKFADTVSAAGNASLGRLVSISPVARFPLRRVVASRWVAEHVALIGDAAHAIHPLAGQGANLGFGDARCLGELLASLSPLSSVGDLAVLRKFERSRRESATALAIVTDRLKGLFAHPARGVARLRNTGLNLTDRQAWVKRRLMQYAMQ
jgi:2-polyprenylphenol 6-hydroxylase